MSMSKITEMCAGVLCVFCVVYVGNVKKETHYEGLCFVRRPDGYCCAIGASHLVRGGGGGLSLLIR